MAIIFFLMDRSIPALKEVGLFRFFSDSAWYPSEQQYGLLPMWIGTIYTSALAVFIAAPTSLLISVFGHYYCPKVLAQFFRTVIQLIAGIPSVVFGFWGLVTLVPFIQSIQPPGQSLLAGSIVLALMVFPTMVIVMSSTFQSLPREDRWAADALGISRWSLFWKVESKEVVHGVFTGIILGGARALGETMAVLMVCGNIVSVPDSVFQPVRTLTTHIALEMAYAMGTHQSALFVSGLMLTGGVALLLFLPLMRLSPYKTSEKKR